jgi:hypothetical protein
MTTRQFHIGDILSVTTGVMVSPRMIAGVYDILNFMTGDNLYTHQLPRSAREMGPELLRQHPQLKGVDATCVTNDETWRAWLAERIAEFGETLPVGTAHQFHELVDPLEEADRLIGKERVIPVILGDEP